MEDIKLFWKKIIAETLAEMEVQGAKKISFEDVSIETPPREELGDIAFPLFPFSRIFHMPPAKIGEELIKKLDSKELLKNKATFKMTGAYIDVVLNKGAMCAYIIEGILKAGESYGSSQLLKDKRIVVEFSGPNTNKPLHLGHLRNDVIGEALCRTLSFSGAKVRRVNIINDRGVHICKSMFAYEKLADGKTPETEGLKSDHFVGDLYVAFHNYQKEHPEAEAEVKAMLQKWEAGDDEHLMSLWKKMNDWALKGIGETYKRTDVSFDQLYYESKTYLKGKDEVLKGLKKGVFYKKEDGSVAVDLKPINIENEKILLRQDGTSLYITQDLGTAFFRSEDWPFDRMIYVVASEQEHHFKVLFYLLKLLGYKWADDMHHLSYGMVNLPEGKMKSREGTVVDADNLLDSLHASAKKEILEKGHTESIKDVDDTAEKIALAALHYFLLQVSPKKDMLFDPQKSLSFNGNTGPYLQYMGSRISSLLEKAKSIEEGGKKVDYALLKNEAEWALAKILSQFPEKVERSATEMDLSIIATYLYDLSKSFSKFYHDCQVISEDEPLTLSRLSLCRAALITLKNGMRLCVLPFIDAM